MQNKFEAKYLNLVGSRLTDEKRLLDENYLESLTQENIFISRNSDQNTISHLAKSSFLNHSIVFISVIISSLLLLLLLVSLIIVSNLVLVLVWNEF